MNLPNFKDILKVVLEKLSILRNNVSVLISVIIALVGILLFVPTQLLSRSLKNDIQQESMDNLYKKMKQLEGKVVNQEQLKTIDESFNALAKDVNGINLLAEQTTQRELLKYDIFNLDPNDPNKTVSQSVFNDFSRRFCDKIDEFVSVHNANFCPTQGEIENELKQAGIESLMQGRTGVMGGAYVNSQNQENIQGIMIDQICQKRANSTFVYLDPYQISGYGFWLQYVYSSWFEDIENCWYSQLGYWVVEDIFNTIAAINTGNESLVTAPVKRLMKISFAEDEMAAGDGLGTNVSKKYTDRPYYIRSSDEIPKETLTGRYTDENYDVIHFKAKLVINTNDLMRFMRQLCTEKEHKYIDKSQQTHTYKHNQITVIGMNVRSVDMKSTDHELYRYGENINVSEVELKCEYIFNRKGYVDIMPQSVKDFLGVTNQSQ